MSVYSQIAQDIAGVGAIMSAAGVGWTHVRMTWHKNELDAELSQQDANLEAVHQAVLNGRVPQADREPTP